jgi:hypothetical protein
MFLSCSCKPLFVYATVAVCAFVSCSKTRHTGDESETRHDVSTAEINFLTQEGVSIRALNDRDLAYLLNQFEIVAESPLPHLLPPNFKYAYRIMGVSEQGNCHPICPRSTIFVAVSNYSDYQDGHIRLYRIDGARFWHFMRVEEFKADETNGYFLSFRFNSIPHPQQPEQYVAKIGFDHATVEPGPPGIPKPAHRFQSLFQRKDAGIFRITFRQGDVFRLWNFEPDDPSVSGDDDAWNADAKEAISSKNWKGVGDRIRMGFRESDVIEILDEQSGQVVFKRELYEH